MNKCYYYVSRCLNCFDCPCCFQTLSVRAGHAPIKQAPSTAEDQKVPPKKVYYLFCSLCRWSSRDAGIPDQYVGEQIIYTTFLN